jgi:hypothetical protein
LDFAVIIIFSLYRTLFIFFFGGKPMSRFFSFMAGSIMGAAVGAAMALLLTPYSGDELRELAREAAYAKREQMEARMRDLQETRRYVPAPEEEV